MQEKTRAAAAPRKPKNGAVSSPLKAEEDMIDYSGELDRTGSGKNGFVDFVQISTLPVFAFGGGRRKEIVFAYIVLWSEM